MVISNDRGRATSRFLLHPHMPGKLGKFRHSTFRAIVYWDEK